jgi:hypothetical protein
MRVIWAVSIMTFSAITAITPTIFLTGIFLSLARYCVSLRTTSTAAFHFALLGTLPSFNFATLSRRLITTVAAAAFVQGRGRKVFAASADATSTCTTTPMTTIVIPACWFSELFISLWSLSAFDLTTFSSRLITTVAAHIARGG